MSDERGRLEARGLRPRKRFGQNFLVDPRIPDLTVERASWPAASPVLEIGPGGGALTAALLRAGHPVVAIEVDRDLVPVLRERFADEIEKGRCRIVEGDALAVDWESVFESSGVGPREGDERRLPWRPWIAGNLPYAITTPLLLRALAARDVFAGAVFMMQREYGERLAAEPGSKTYGSITVWTRAHASARALLKVGRSAFWPRPGVESVVVELVFVEPKPYQGDGDALQAVLRAAFGQRRKQIANALASGLGREKADVAERLLRAGVDPEVRAEMLGLAEFARIVGEM